MRNFVATSFARFAFGTEGRQADGDDQRVWRDVRGGSEADPERPGRQDCQKDASKWGECD